MELLLNLYKPALYILIFIAKTIEVTISTIRLVFINKGEKVKGAILGFFEILIWVLLVNTVLTNITEDPFKVFAYAAGFAMGNYIGVSLESRIAVGLASIQVVVNEDVGNCLSEMLRNDGYGVTIIDGRGKDDSKKCLLFVQLKRKKIPSAIKIIRQASSDAYITVNDIRSMMGGFIKK